MVLQDVTAVWWKVTDIVGHIAHAIRYGTPEQLVTPVLHCCTQHSAVCIWHQSLLPSATERALNTGH